MNYGNVAKRFAFDKGLRGGIDAIDGEVYGEGKPFTPARLEKANAAFDKLRDIMERRWKLVEVPKKKAKKKAA